MSEPWEQWQADLYLDLKWARERLCRAQAAIADESDRERLGVAITSIDIIGSDWCGEQWSRFDQPKPATP